jgi:hypothetical protein
LRGNKVKPKRPKIAAGQVAVMFVAAAAGFDLVLERISRSFGAAYCSRSTLNRIKLGNSQS